MIDELKKLREITETLTGNGYLKDQAEEWEYALDAIPDCIYIINTRFEIRFSNKALCEKMEQTKEGLYGKICYEVIFGCNDASLFPDWRLSKESHDAISVKNIFVDKLCGWYDVTRAPIYTKSNNLIGFICILQDITDKRIADNTVKHREALLDAVFDSVPVGIGIIDKESRVLLSVNKHMIDFTGYSEYELIRKTDRVLYKYEHTYTEVGKLIESKTNGTVRGSIITKSGSELYVDIKIYAIGSSDPDKALIIMVNEVPISIIKDRRLRQDFSKIKSPHNHA